MTKRISIPADAVLVAIDKSKHRQEVLIERPEGGRRRRMTVMATKADYDRLAADLAEIGRPIIVGFEATGNYHRTLAHRLLAAGFELRLISSVALARTREALHNGWDKNDSKDAQVILHMLRIGATQRYVDPLAAGINDLQEMSKSHEAISKAKTQTWHRILTHYLPLYFPEIERFAGNSRSDWFLALLERFPTPVSMTALGQEAFTREACPFPAPTATHAQPFLAVDAQQLLVVGGDALPRQQIAQTAIAEPAALRRQLTQPLPQRPVIGPRRLVTDHPAAHTNQCTRPTLAHPVMLPGMGDGFPLGAGRYHFFDARSFRTALSSIASAKSFFSREFSSSSDRSRRASDTSSPPNFDFHL